jgi:hypothetical protein
MYLLATARKDFLWMILQQPQVGPFTRGQRCAAEGKNLAFAIIQLVLVGSPIVHERANDMHEARQVLKQIATCTPMPKISGLAGITYDIMYVR